MKVYYQICDENSDGINDCVIVFSKDFGIPLIGDFRGVQLAIIPFSSPEGSRQAEELARIYVHALSRHNDLPCEHCGEKGCHALMHG